VVSAALLFVSLAFGVSAADATTDTFTYTGGGQQWFVPPGVTEVTFDVRGAGGEAGDNYKPDSSDSTPGLGATVVATLAVTPGERLVVWVGGTGSAGVGGFGGGGAGCDHSGAGGGASTIWRDPGPARVLVAGGGGGGGCGGQREYCSLNMSIAFAGGGGGPSGGPGGDGSHVQGGKGGGAGTATAPGAGGAGGAHDHTAAADSGDPGAADDSGWGGAGGGSNLGADQGGGGGGGGYYGGGGGGQGGGSDGDPWDPCAFDFAPGGGGGGGSSLVPPGGSVQEGTRSGNGTVTVTYGEPGSGGQPNPPGGGDVPDTLSPTIASASVRSKRFRVGRAATPVSAARRPPVGTSFLYDLSEAARVEIQIARKSRGRRVAGKCRKATHSNRRRPRCTLYLSLGTLVRNSVRGPNAVPFSGRIGKKALRPGSYRAGITATDAAGNRSAPRHVSFTVVR
jgi:hypothetical protein